MYVAVQTFVRLIDTHIYLRAYEGSALFYFSFLTLRSVLLQELLFMRDVELANECQSDLKKSEEAI